MRLAVPASQMRTCPSSLAVATLLPPSMKAAESMVAVWDGSVRASLPVERSQSRIALSVTAVARRFPSGDAASAIAHRSLRPDIITRSTIWPSIRSIRQIVPSWPDATIHWSLLPAKAIIQFRS